VAAFTMIEIALCLGVIAIALVAIIGVLPTGVRVQKDNREDTIINQEGQLLLEAIRSGSQGLDYLTNFFELITISNSLNQAVVYTHPDYQFAVTPPAVFGGYLTNGQRIIGLLTTYKYPPLSDPQNPPPTNYVSAVVQAISGSAAEKSESVRSNGMAFAYRVISEVVPLHVHPQETTNFTANGLAPVEMLARSNLWRIARNEAANSYELRLTLQGPVIWKGKTYDVLGTRKTFRTLISGSILVSPASDYFVQPSTFVQVP